MSSVIEDEELVHRGLESLRYVMSELERENLPAVLDSRTGYGRDRWAKHLLLNTVLVSLSSKVIVCERI